MANFQKKYYYTFKSLINSSYTVELWQDSTNTITSSQISGDELPFKVSYPSTKNKFESVRGSGCDINILSTTSMKFIDLYQTDMMGCQIRFYSGSTNLLWCGYLTSELYSEPFAEYDNYKVNMTGNDGLALLERLDFLQNDGSDYTGFMNNWTIITTILGKLNLSWNKIYVSLTTTSDNLTIGSTDTILTKTYSYADNYYDEDNKPMNCRQVLETILTPLSAYIQIINGNVYITDINNLANTNASFKQYNGTTFAYETNTTINLTIGDLSTIKFSSNSQTFNILSPINKQKVIFSPYIPKVIEYDVDKDIFSGTTTTSSYGTYPKSWTETKYGTSTSWSKYNPTNLTSTGYFAELTGTGNNEGTNDKYLKLSYINVPYALGSHPDLFTYTGKVPKMIGASTYYLKIEISAYCRTTDNMGDSQAYDIKRCRLNTTLKVGSRKYANSINYAGEWVDQSEAGYYLELDFMNITKSDSGEVYNSISDQWQSINGATNLSMATSDPWKSAYIIPLDSSINGDLSFVISDYKIYSNDSIMSQITTNIKDVRLKDIKISIVDSKYNSIENKDEEYWSYVDKKIKDDGADVTCKLGTNTDLIPVAKGGILGYNANNLNYFYVTSFNRQSKTDILENLLARSITSNYSGKTIEIQCQTNKIDSIFGTLTYNNYWNGIKFGIMGADIDYSEDTIDWTLQEISPDSGDIKKNY